MGRSLSDLDRGQQELGKGGEVGMAWDGLRGAVRSLLSARR